MYLTRTTDQLWLYADSAATVDWQVSWEDSDINAPGARTITPGSIGGSLSGAGSALLTGNGTTTQTSAFPLGKNVARRVRFASAHNKSSSAVASAIRFSFSPDSGTTLYTLCSATLQPGETLMYEADHGFYTAPVFTQATNPVTIAARQATELEILNEILNIGLNAGIDTASMRADPLYQVI